jgi:hypothetical protein
MIDRGNADRFLLRRWHWILGLFLRDGERAEKSLNHDDEMNSDDPLFGWMP